MTTEEENQLNTALSENSALRAEVARLEGVVRELQNAPQPPPPVIDIPAEVANACARADCAEAKLAALITKIGASISEAQSQ